MITRAADSPFRLENYRQQYTIKMPGKYHQGQISFERTSPRDIVLAVEPMTIEGPVGAATIRLHGKSADIDFITPDQSSLRFSAHTAKDGRITITSTSPNGTDSITIDPDGTLDVSGAGQAPFGTEFLPLVQGLHALSKPLSVLSSIPDPSVTVFDENTGGGSGSGGKTRSQCNTDYVNAMKNAAGVALAGAATAAGAASTGLGALAGLGILAGTALIVSSMEDSAGDALEQCLAQAPD